MPLRPGEAYIYRPGEVHTFISDGDWDVYWATFDGPASHSILQGFQLLHGPCFGILEPKRFERLFEAFEEGWDERIIERIGF